ncbi:MAG: flagellar protein FlgN [Clostridia bacterium]|nr:flagellar protein FlgN [Clostridia bacterium]
MEELISILKEQVKSYEQLLELAKKKQQALIGNDIEVLDNLNKEEHGVILGATKLEKKRLEVIKAMAGIFGKGIESWTLKEMTEKAPEPFQGPLSEVYQELNSVVEQLQKINQENSSLIEQALKIVDFTINTITRTEREVVYPEKDSKNVKPVSRIFDSKV